MIERVYHKVREVFDGFLKWYVHTIPDIKHATYEHMMKNIASTRYIDDDIMSEARSSLTRYIEFNICIQDMDLEISTALFFKHGTPQHMIEWYYFMANLAVYTVLHMGHPYSIKQHISNRTMSMTILLTKQKKQKCKDVCVLGPKNVNSGVTFTSITSIDIVVFREEEVFKVLMHELIHGLALDFGMENVTYVAQREAGLMKRWHVQHPLRLNESFTDTWACLLNICLFSRMYAILENKSDDVEVMQSTYDVEKKYILRKAGDVVHHMTRFYKKYGYYQENSHVISYYIVKAGNFHNMSDFLKHYFDGHGYIKKGTYDDYISSIESYRFYDFLVEKEAGKGLRMTHIDNSSFIKRWKSKLFKNIMVKTIHQNAF